MKKEKDLKEKSDFGLPIQLDFMDEMKSFNQLTSLIQKQRKYDRFTERINSYLKNVMDNYLRIGLALNEIDSEKLYELYEYSSIIDYAKKEFQLSETTVRNSMAISTKFCNENGYLHDEYKEFSYSQLVELLSVDKLELNDYKPSMSVKVIRSKKLINQIDKSLSTVYSTGLVKSIIDYIEHYDFNKDLNTKYFKISYVIKKHNDDFLTVYGGFNFLINFKLINEISKQSLSFDIKYDDHFKFNTPSPTYMWERFETLDELSENIKKYCKKLIQNSAINPEDKEIKQLKKEPQKFISINKVPSYYGSSIVSSLKEIDIQNEVYYNHKNNDIREIYTKPEISKKNPPYLLIENAQDPFNLKLKFLVGIENKEPIYKEDEGFHQVINELKVKFEETIKMHLQNINQKDSMVNA